MTTIHPAIASLLQEYECPYDRNTDPKNYIQWLKDMVWALEVELVLLQAKACKLASAHGVEAEQFVRDFI